MKHDMHMQDRASWNDLIKAIVASTQKLEDSVHMLAFRDHCARRRLRDYFIMRDLERHH